jgi:Zn-dependent oligopeptidase
MSGPMVIHAEPKFDSVYFDDAAFEETVEFGVLYSCIVPHSYHSFSGEYAASVYVYLWADVMAADVAEAFANSPGGFYDPEVSERWCRTILSVGNTVPAEEAFRSFLGRDPDPDALLLLLFGLEVKN